MGCQCIEETDTHFHTLIHAKRGFSIVAYLWELRRNGRTWRKPKQTLGEDLKLISVTWAKRYDDFSPSLTFFYLLHNLQHHFTCVFKLFQYNEEAHLHAVDQQQVCVVVVKYERRVQLYKEEVVNHHTSLNTETPISSYNQKPKAAAAVQNLQNLTFGTIAKKRTNENKNKKKNESVPRCSTKSFGKIGY